MRCVWQARAFFPCLSHLWWLAASCDKLRWKVSLFFFISSSPIGAWILLRKTQGLWRYEKKFIRKPNETRNTSSIHWNTKHLKNSRKIVIRCTLSHVGHIDSDFSQHGTHINIITINFIVIIISGCSKFRRWNSYVCTCTKCAPINCNVSCSHFNEWNGFPKPKKMNHFYRLLVAINTQTHIHMRTLTSKPNLNLYTEFKF